MAATTPPLQWNPGSGGDSPASHTARSPAPTDSAATDSSRPRPAGPLGPDALEDELDQSAYDLVSIHRPARKGIGWRRRWGLVPWLVYDKPLCVFCGRPWVCPPAVWAHGRLSMLGTLGHERVEDSS